MSYKVFCVTDGDRLYTVDDVHPIPVLRIQEHSQGPLLLVGWLFGV